MTYRNRCRNFLISLIKKYTSMKSLREFFSLERIGRYFSEQRVLWGVKFSSAFLGALICTGMISPANAQVGFVLNQSKFSFAPHNTNDLEDFVWAINQLPSNPDPNILIAFAGRPDSSFSCAVNTHCESDLNSGCVDDVYAASPTLDPFFSEVRTGMYSSQVYMPRCPSGAAIGMRGDTFAAYNPTSSVGGIALYTHTGTANVGGRQSFLQTAQQPTTQDIQGTFATFQGLYAPSSNWMYPFFGASQCGQASNPLACQDGYKVQVATEQRVQNFIDNGFSGAFQNIELIFRNTQGTPSNLLDDKLIQIQIRTWCNFDSIQSTCDEYTSTDPNQNNLRFYGGQLGNPGQTTTMTISSSSYPDYQVLMWTSLGSATSAGHSAAPQLYKATLSWRQFVTMLRGSVFATNQNGANYATVAQFYGSGWGTPENWILSTVRFGQEISNENWDGSFDPSLSAKRSSFGGAMRWFNVIAITN